MKELLGVIKFKVLNSDSVYSHNEDERMAVPALHVFERRLLSDQQVLNWISDFSCKLEEQKGSVSDPEGLNILLNVGNFLTSLYFRLKFENIGESIQKEIEKVLDSIREF